MSWEPAARILVAEARDDEREVLVRLLQSHGYEARGARTAAEVRERVAAERFDLLVVHRGLPDETGTTMLRDLRDAGHLGTTKAVIITGQPEARSEGGFPVVKKPVDPALLLSFVESAVGRPQGPGPAPTPADTTAAALDLALYISPPWPSSVRALRNIERAIALVPKGAVRLQVFDMARDPLRAEQDRILFSPTLVKLRPEPRVWLLGDLSDTAVVDDLLASAGLSVARPT